MCAFCLLPLPSIPIPFLSHPLLLTFLSFFPLCRENSRFKQFFGLGKMNIVRVQFYILLFWSIHVLLCLNTLVTHTCRMRAFAASSDSSQSFSIASHTCNIASCRTKHTSSCFLNNKSLSKWMLCVFEWAFESVRRAFHADMYRQRVNTLYIYIWMVCRCCCSFPTTKEFLLILTWQTEYRVIERRTNYSISNTPSEIRIFCYLGMTAGMFTWITN